MLAARRSAKTQRVGSRVKSSSATSRRCAEFAQRSSDAAGDDDDRAADRRGAELAAFDLEPERDQARAAHLEALLDRRAYVRRRPARSKAMTTPAKAAAALPVAGSSVTPQPPPNIRA